MRFLGSGLFRDDGLTEGGFFFSLITSLTFGLSFGGDIKLAKRRGFSDVGFLVVLALGIGIFRVSVGIDFFMVFVAMRVFFETGLPPG